MYLSGHTLYADRHHRFQGSGVQACPSGWFFCLQPLSSAVIVAHSTATAYRVQCWQRDFIKCDNGAQYLGSRRASCVKALGAVTSQVPFIHSCSIPEKNNVIVGVSFYNDPLMVQWAVCKTSPFLKREIITLPKQQLKKLYLRTLPSIYAALSLYVPLTEKEYWLIHQNCIIAVRSILSS